MRISHWNMETIKKCRRVADGDKITYPNGSVGSVGNDYLHLDGDANRAIIGMALGLHGDLMAGKNNDAIMAFCHKAYGHKPGGGDCPTTTRGMPALTRLLKALFASLATMTPKKALAAEKKRLAEAAAERKRINARLAALPVNLRDVIAYDAKHQPFGCQRKHALNAMGLAFGVKDLATIARVEDEG